MGPEIGVELSGLPSPFASGSSVGATKFQPPLPRSTMPRTKLSVAVPVFVSVWATYIVAPDCAS